MKDRLSLLIRQEIARLSLRSSPGVLIICLIAFFSVFGIQSNVNFVKSCSLLSFLIICSRIYFAKKVLSNAEGATEFQWQGLRSSYLTNSIVWSLIFSLTVWELDGASPYYFVIFAMLAGFVANLLFSVSMDTLIFITSQIIILAPLMIIAIFQSLKGIDGHSKYLFLAYIIYAVYLSLQYKWIKKQSLDRLKSSLDLELNNKELLKSKLDKENFLNLVLEILSKDMPHKTTLETIVMCVEQFNISNLCSIMLLNQEKTRFEVVVAPKIPAFFNEAMTQVEVGERVGSCGTCVVTGERVIVEDIQNHPYWTPFKELAARAGLGSSWSEPIKDPKGNILGTFALYQHGPHYPSEKELQLIKQAAHIVGIALQRFETEKNLLHTQDQLSLIYNSTVDGMWLVTVEDKNVYRIDTVNDAFVRSTGFSREDVIGKTVEETVPKASLPLVMEKYTEALTSGKQAEYQSVVLLPSGLRTAFVRLIPIKDNTGKITKLLGVAEDVTESKRKDELLREQDIDLRYAQKVAQMGNWKWNVTEDIVTWSPELYNILEMDPSQPAPSFKHLHEIYTPESWTKLEQAVTETLTNGTPYKIDLEVKIKGKKTKWLLTSGEVLEKDAYGKVISLVGTVQNITDRKNLENELTSALKARDEFFLVASHELKTPLTTLQLSLHGMSRLLRSENLLGNEKLVSKLNMATKQSERLEVLIKNLLDVSRMSTDGVELQTFKEVNISRLLDEAALKCEEEIQRNGSVLSKDIQTDVICECDPVRIEQVVTNLLTNAQKYGGGNPIQLRMKQIDSVIRIEVEDHGIGIPAEKLQIIFERFKRADDDHSYKGLGLGLWIVSEIVIAHHGNVWVESEVNKGSTFIVELKQELT